MADLEILMCLVASLYVQLHWPIKHVFFLTPSFFYTTVINVGWYSTKELNTKKHLES